MRNKKFCNSGSRDELSVNALWSCGRRKRDSSIRVRHVPKRKLGHVA